MNRKSLGWPLLAALMIAALAATGAQAQTQSAPEGDKPAKSKSKKAAKSGAASGGKVTFIQGSGETPAQRTARLKRECKGAVDAGVCTGYTR
ncbi:hypothetical protein [Polaromonas sp. YR568]|uniref:hypothetical protein n=1 Tax=Polaromonas sp. YR568 TaxID=1855301 RepID=UPI00398BD05C